MVDGENTTYYDPMFVNVYAMEGDNADMIWETEGLWFETAANASCLFNEKIGPIDRNITDQEDPDRYVGIRKGGEFRIPKLYKDDRVIIYMGSAKGSGAEDEETGGKRTLLFEIENARDAVYQPITDTYWVGGSLWNVYDATPNNHRDPNYRGAYHFFATGDPNDDSKPADMIFKLTEGALCKIYSIEIYHDGTHHYTNSIQQPSWSKYDLWNDNTSGNLTVGANGDSNQLDIHYRGKGEKIALNDGNIKNEVLTYTGNISNFTINTVNNSSISYTSKVGDFGTMLVRVKVMDYNQKYVTDFGDRNLTIGYKEKKAYPYTWDFTDMSLFSGTDIAAENNNYPKSTYVNGTSRAAWEDPKIWNLSIWEKAVDPNTGENILIDGKPVYKMNVYTPGCSQEGAELNAYYLFANNKNGGGNELHANGKIIPETQGLMFYMDNNTSAYNGSMQIAADGLHFANTKRTVNGSNTLGWWNYKMVVPEVPDGAAVYLRMTRDTSVGDNDYSQKQGENPVYFLQTKFNFGTDTKTVLTTDNGQAPVYNTVVNSGNYSFYNIDGTDDWIIAVKNTKGAASNLTFTLNGWIVKKLSVSEDFKKVNKFGWATESRDHVIDQALTTELTGNTFETYVVTGADYASKTVTIEKVNTSQKVMKKADEGGNQAYIIRNMDMDYSMKDANGKDAPGLVKILDDGFHLFVPDMHDFIKNRKDGFTNQKSEKDMGSSKMKALLGPQTLNKKGEGNIYNYVLTTTVNQVGMDVEKPLNDVGFYRVKNGSSSAGNQGYLPVDCTVPTGTTDGGGAKMSLVFVSFDDSYENVETAIEVPFEVVSGSNNAVYYNLNGQKLSGKPTQGGLYIVNGKKVLVK